MKPQPSLKKSPPKKAPAERVVKDIATAEDVTPVYVGRVLKLAYLAPAVLERLLIERRAPAVSVKDLGLAVDLPWVAQHEAVFGGE